MHRRRICIRSRGRRRRCRRRCRCRHSHRRRVAVRVTYAHVHRPVQDDLFGLRPVVNMTAQQKLRTNVPTALHVIARDTCVMLKYKYYNNCYILGAWNFISITDMFVQSYVFPITKTCLNIKGKKKCLNNSIIDR